MTLQDLFSQSFNLTTNTVFFPVRHHSPACSWHLERVFEEYQPDCILIEGPEDTNHLNPLLVHSDTETPIAIYYSFHDKGGMLGEKDKRYRCYYPFLDYSPELVILKKGLEHGVKTEFIDLNYPNILLASQEQKGLRKEGRKQAYGDEHRLFQSHYIQTLCEKEGVRDFNELWEKHYEVNGLGKSTADFVHSMLGYCYYARIEQSEESLEAEGCLARERFMAEKIREAQEKYDRVLVVTGGFHTLGLVELLNAKKPKKQKVRKIKPEEVGTFPMAYSFREADQVMGYASGMPHPAFYQKVWDNIQSSGIDDAYRLTVRDYVVRTGRAVRKLEEPLSTADEIEALNLALGLRDLRKKRDAGVYELLDGVHSCFIKGELSDMNATPLQEMGKLLQGERFGNLCDEAPVPPILEDFREQCQKLKLKVATNNSQEEALSIYQKPLHLRKSHFFHILNYLGTAFCELKKGPDFAKQKDTNLIREIWEYRMSPSVEGMLVELSIFGGSLKEAGRELLLQSLKNAVNSREVAKLLVEAFRMGLGNEIPFFLPQLKEKLQSDHEFDSLSDACFHLNYLFHAHRLLDFKLNEELEEVLKQGWSRTALLVATLGGTRVEEEDKRISSLRGIYQLLLEHPRLLDQQLLQGGLESLLNLENGNVALQGASAGLLLGLGEMERADVVKRAEGFFYGTGHHFANAVSFLKGLFATARETLLSGGELLQGLDHILQNVGEEEFLAILPELRLAFSFFNPSDINKIGGQVAELYQTTEKEVLDMEALDEAVLKEAERLNTVGEGLLMNI